MNKKVSFYGRTGLPEAMNYEVGDEPTFIVHGRIISVDNREALLDGSPEVTYTFDVKAADIDEGDGVKLMLPVAEPLPKPLPKRVPWKLRFWTTVGFVWPLATYALGVFVGSQH